MQFDITPLSKLLVWSPQNNTPVLCFDIGFGGTLWWKIDDFAPNALSISTDESTCYALCTSEAGMYLQAIEMDSGEVQYTKSVSEKSDAHLELALPSALSSDSQTLYVAIKNVVFTVALTDEAPGPQMFTSELSSITSLAASTEALVAASLEVEGQDESTYATSYSIDLFTEGSAWNVRDHCAMIAAGPRGSWYAVAGIPTVRGFVQTPELAAICTAGDALQVICIETGEILYSQIFATPISGLGMIGEDSPFLIVATVEGNLTALSIEDKSFESNLKLQGATGIPNTKVEFFFQNNIPIALMRPVDSPNEVIGYTLDLRLQEEIESPTYDELIEKAEATIENFDHFAWTGIPHPL